MRVGTYIYVLAFALVLVDMHVGMNMRVWTIWWACLCAFECVCVHAVIICASQSSFVGNYRHIVSMCDKPPKTTILFFLSLKIM